MKTRVLASVAPVLLLVACGASPADGPTPPPAPAMPAASTAAVASAPSPPPACGPGTTALPDGSCLPDAPPVESKPAPPPACGDGMALVPGGTFEVGPKDKREKITVAAFCMDVSETTADQYAACVKAGGCTDKEAKCAAQATYGAEGKGNHPMVCVDFAQANAFCAAQKKRLATNEEWEWAARGGAEGRTYPWGNDAPADQLCWSGKEAHKGTCPVASFAKGDSPQGIHDLAGNVYEWTTTKNDAKSPIRDGRGGSWRDGSAALVKSSRAGGFAPSYRCGFLGIRCVTAAPLSTRGDG
jgi:formylglycine-generating enzyme required for sulfatase activity